jgi:hypothetical protein
MESISFIQEGVRELICATNVSSLSLDYREVGGTNPQNTFQSIAYGNWSLILQTDGDLNYLECDAYGFVDNLAITNLDSESTNVLNEIAGLFEILYWLYLADFGQISPTVYPLFGYGDLLQPEPSNFAKVEQLPPTYNVFVNSSRYEMLSTWTTDFMQYVGGSPPTNTTNAPLFNETNGLPLQPNETTIVVSYPCQQRIIKSPLSFIVTIIAADYALVMGGYKIVVWIALRFEKRRRTGTSLDAVICSNGKVSIYGCLLDRRTLRD